MDRLNILTRWPGILWLILFPALAALVAASRVEDHAEKWQPPADLGPADALSELALLPDPPAVVWRSASALMYQRLDGRQSPQRILSYPDVHPRRWQIAPAGSGRYHIVWLEDNHRLRSALISTDGETLRGPILLADAIRPDFVTLPADQAVIVIWLNEHADEVNTLTIDPAGRPGPITNVPVSRVIRVAGARDETNIVHLAWLTAPAPDSLTVYYQASDAAALSMDNPVTMASFTLSAGDSLTGFSAGLDESHGYILWSISSAQRPDAEQVQVLAFPLGSPTQSQRAELPSSGDALRWPRPAPRQQSALSLAVQVRTPDGWRPAVISFRAGLVTDFSVVVPLPADSGPPAVAVNPAGDLTVAWTGLDGMEPQLYISTTGAAWSTARDDPDHMRARTLTGAGVGIVLAGVWLLLPCGLLWLAPGGGSLALALYTASKLVWPADYFSQLPPWMAAADLDQYVSPPWIVGGAVLVIGQAAGLVWFGARGWDHRRRWIASLLTDAMLTGLIFGANFLR